MNRVFLRTDKGEYYPGDYVCGAVYLEIRAPTEGHGIQLSFKGTESARCEYHEQTGVRTSLHSGAGDGGKGSHKATRDYVDYSNTDLYKQSVPFALGHYCLPFRLQLPQLMPGTFTASGSDGSKVWSVVVEYQLMANVAGAEDMVVQHEVVVRAVTPELLRDINVTQAQCMEFPAAIKILGIFGKKILVTVKPLENVIKTGERAHLRMVITNKSPSQICTFSVKLARRLIVKIPVKTREEVRGEFDIELQKQLVTIADEPHTVIREMSGSLSAHDSRSFARGGGFDNLIVPLKTMDGKDVVPTVHGEFVQCDYSLEVSMHFGDQKVRTVTCDIPRVLPADNTQWLEWKPQPWMKTAEVKLGNTPISPSKHLLEGEAFSKLPPFQEL